MVRFIVIVATMMVAVCCMYVHGATATAASSSSPLQLGFTDLSYSFDETLELSLTGPNGGAPTLPEWLEGTLFRNGPARYHLGNGMPNITHWFNGLALTHAFQFQRGKSSVAYRGNWVRSTLYNTSRPGVKASNPDGGYSPNTPVTFRRVAGHLLSNTGYSVSNEFDANLNTVSAPFNYDDHLFGEGADAPSHSIHDPEGNEVHYANNFTAGSAGYYMYTIAAGSATRKMLAIVPPNPHVGVPLYQHSLSLTQNYAIIVETPCTIGRNGWRSFQWLPELGTTFKVVSRSNGTVVAQVPTDAFFQMHTVNAYEEVAGEEEGGATTIIVDCVTYPNNDILNALYLETLLHNPNQTAEVMSKTRLTRFYVPLDGSPVTSKVLSGIPMEMPTVPVAFRTRQYRYMYANGLSDLGAEFPNTIVKVDVTGATPAKVWHQPNCWGQEPLFVPSPAAVEATQCLTAVEQGLLSTEEAQACRSRAAAAEDDGIVTTTVLDAAAGRSFLLVLDAKTFAELGRASLPFHIPLGFHGRFYADIL